MIERAHHDFETRNALNLKRVGVHKYVRHPSFGIWTMAWRIGRGPKQVWRPGYPDPLPLLDHVYNGGTMVAHNAGFEREVWNVGAPAHWPRITIAQQDCTMARARAVGLPGGLDALCGALKLPDRKDAAGSKLMKQMMKPRKIILCEGCGGRGTVPEYMGGPVIDCVCSACMETGHTYTWWDDDERRDRLDLYCLDDVEAETGVDETVPHLTPRERLVWELDQRINERGVSLDKPMIETLDRVCDIVKLRLDQEMARLTGGAVTGCMQHAKLAQWITDQGVPCRSVAAEEHEELLLEADKHAVSPLIHQVIQVRGEASKASTAKLGAMRETMDEAGRSHDLLAYHATLQGRWAGRLWQPQNVKTREDEEVTDAALAIVLAEQMPDPALLVEAFNVLFRAPLEMCSLMLRSLIVAAKRKRLVGGDLSNIEGRVAAWLVNEEWKIKAFHDYDDGKGPDLYRMSYATSFGVAVELVLGAMRQVGKVSELSSQYQGAVAAYVKMARKKNVKLSRVRDTVKAAATPEEWSLAVRAYPQANDKAGLDCETWAAVAIVVKRWRKQNEQIVNGWWELQDAAIEAVSQPGSIASCFGGRVRYLAARGFLWCGVPSGRAIGYFRPELRQKDESYLLYEDGRRLRCDTLFDYEIDDILTRHEARLVKRTKNFVTFEHMREEGGYGREALYGGMQMAHVVSGIARDILVDVMLEADSAGYLIGLTVHDDVLTEVDEDDTTRTAAGLLAMMSRKPAWIDGDLPLSAKCWEGPRNAK